MNENHGFILNSLHSRTKHNHRMFKTMNDEPPPSNEEKEAESSSSSSGKEESGEGYSADCSGSDQSLDGNNRSSNPAERNDDADERSAEGAKALADDASTQKKQRKRSSQRKEPPKEEGFDVWEGLDEEVSTQLDPTPPTADAEDGPNKTKLPYAQWNGVNVSNPMDQRVDFSTMALANAAYSEFILKQQQTASAQSSTLHKEQQKQRSQEVSTVSLESYARLLEVSECCLETPG